MPPIAFISSTVEDLESYRRAADNGVRTAGCHGVMHEYWVAKDNPPLEECMKRVSRVDVLVVVVAHRYGWVPPEQAKSITWLECERAVMLGKKVLAFVVDDEVKWPAEYKETYRVTQAMEDGTFTPELAAEVNGYVGRLREFKQWLKSRAITKTFRNEDDLCGKVSNALREWSGGPPQRDTTRYLEWMREETGWIDIRGLQVGTGKVYRFPIEELYIPLKTAQGEDLREIVGRSRRLVIEGDAGSGKTTLLRWMVKQMCGPGEDRLPVFVRIKDLLDHIRHCRRSADHGAPGTAQSAEWLVHFLAKQSIENGWELDAGFFVGKLKEEGTVVFLDGLDEAPNRTERESVARLFEQATQVYEKCRFVVTTRPQAYEDLATLNGFSEVPIAELSNEAIEGFLERWSRALFPDSAAQATAHQQALAEILRERVEIRRMARNPVMLTALAVVYRNERRLPEQRAELFESILMWLARSREQREGRASADRCLNLLGVLALAMQTQEKGRITEIQKGPAADAIASQFRELPEDERRGRALAFLDEEEVDSGILLSRGTELRFWHLTFREFLAARAIAGMQEEAQRTLLLTRKRLYLPEWREVMLLLGGILLAKQGPEKVDGLFTAVLDDLGEKAGLFEQARCAGLLGTMLRDLQPLSYQPGDKRYDELMMAVLGIFDADRGEVLSLSTRLEVAEALGQAGDPRLRLPRDKDYWVRILSGVYRRGERREYEVYLDAFDIGKHPVTVWEYRRFVEDEGYAEERWWKAGGFGKELAEGWDEQVLHPNRPVVNVSWYEAAAYCAWVGNGVRLLTEAEWERAAGGVEGREYPWGKGDPEPKRANYGETKVGHASPVGMFPLGNTPDGITDLAGNVWEWVGDWFGADYYGKAPRENPRGPDGGEYRVRRGGSWGSGSFYLGAVFRGRNTSGDRYVYVGFRCGREVLL